jgi:exonuclease SbcC
MIPLKLELRNFMAYREADPLDLSGLHVVCLTGDNGAGKSTLLDAMTWALWGQSRANRDDELIAQGATEMRVGFTFSEGREIFQVVRTRRLGKAAKGKPATSSGTLDFLIRDDAVNGWRTITEGKVSETQAKIERTLSLSYDTFINSAYLKQGRADEFTVKPPGQRKQLLAEILNLDVWGEYEERVKQRLSMLERETYKLQHDLKQSEEELSRLPDFERQLGEAQTALDAAKEEMTRADAAHRELMLLRDRVRGIRAQIGQAEGRMRVLDADLQRASTEHESTLERMRRCQAALDQRAEIEAGFAALEQAREQNEQWNLKLSSMVELNGRKSAAEARITEERHKLERIFESVSKRVRDLNAAAEFSANEKQWTAVRARLQQLTADAGRMAVLNAQRLHAGEELGGMRSRNETLKREMNEIKQRMEALSRVGAICPACGRELIEVDRQRLLEEWRARGREKGDEWRANDVRMKQMTEERSRQDAEVSTLEVDQRSVPALQRDEAALTEKRTRAAEAAAALPGAMAELAVAEANLRAEEYAADARADLRQVEAELAVLGYDLAAHQHLRAQVLPGLQGFVVRKAEADRAEAGLQAERTAAGSLQAQVDLLQEKRAEEGRALDELRAVLTAAEAGLADAPAAERGLLAAQKAMQDWQIRFGVANQRVQACRSLVGSAARTSSELQVLQRRGALLEELRTACGRNGVPAMIIESALPELEASANELLGRMTNGRMNVRFDTQRMSQKGDAIETLEIRIADEVGERAYELFSGGEAFRINFAVRIALSRMLARRAGAALRTLFIDEGFGTQDAQGRERLVEAIKAIETDFDRIFVITHIDELRDAFPARIEVTKSTRGSGARVV